jgi:hypothetical protein
MPRSCGIALIIHTANSTPVEAEQPPSNSAHEPRTCSHRGSRNTTFAIDKQAKHLSKGFLSSKDSTQQQTVGDGHEPALALEFFFGDADILDLRTWLYVCIVWYKPAIAKKYKLH